MITETHYRNFHHELATSKLFHYFWQFWANYAFAFFAIAFLIILTSIAFSSVAKPILWISAISFVIARGIVVTEINIFYQRQRPYQKLNFIPITSKFFSWKTDVPNSFPSRHTTSYFSVAVVFALFVPAIGAVLIAVGIMAGIARVILGYHWPSDIVGGAVVGTVTALLTVYFSYPIIFT